MKRKRSLPRFDPEPKGRRLLAAALLSILSPAMASGQDACLGEPAPLAAGFAIVEVRAGRLRCSGVRLDTDHVVTARHCVDGAGAIQVDGAPYEIDVAVPARSHDPTVGDMAALRALDRHPGAGLSPGADFLRPRQCVWIARIDGTFLPCSVLGQAGDRMELECTTQDGDSGAGVLVRDPIDGRARVVAILSARGTGAEAGLAVANSLRALRPLLMRDTREVTRGVFDYYTPSGRRDP